jgi:hypothetical protein
MELLKATGPDEIPAYILKNMADHLAPYLTKLCQISLDHGLVPDNWKKANIVPVFKKGEKHMASNYRPVSLTSIADSESMLLITKDLVAIEVVHDGTMNNVLQ